MSKWIKLESNDQEFPAYLADPSRLAKGGLIVIHEAWGLTDHIKNVAERFAKEGYLVLAPELLSHDLPSDALKLLQEELFDPERRHLAQPKLRGLMAPMQAPEFGAQTIAKLKACFEYLAGQPGTKGKLAITGFCFGGTYSFSLAAEEPGLKAAVPFYGRCELDVDKLKRVKCPILAFYGEKDEGIMTGLDEVKLKMEQAGVNFTAQVYPDCGHAFFNDTNKFAYHQPAAQDAWKKTLAFLDQNLTA